MPEQTKVFSFRMTPLRLARLKAQSAVRGMTTTYLINEAIEQYFDNNPLTDQEQTAYEVMLANYREELK